MGNIKILHQNLLETYSSGLTVTSEDPSFPKYRLYDRSIKKLFKASTAPTDFYIDLVSNRLFDGGMEAWNDASNLTYWNKELYGDGYLARESSEKRAGSYSAKLCLPSSGVAYAQILQNDLSLEMGMTYEIKLSYKYPHSSGQLKIYLFSLGQEYCLQSDGQFHPPPLGSIVLPQANDWTDYSISFVSVTKPLNLRFYLQLYGTGPETVYLDSVCLSQKVNRFIMAKGHNDHSKQVYLFRVDQAGNNVIETVFDPSGAFDLDASFTAKSSPIWKIYSTPNPYVPEIPEIFLGEDHTFSAIPKYGYQEENVRNNSYLETTSGLSRIVKNGDIRRRRSYTLDHLTDVDKSFLETLDLNTQGAKGFYLTDTEGNLMFVEMRNNLRFRRSSHQFWSTDIEFLEIIG